MLLRPSAWNGVSLSTYKASVDADEDNIVEIRKNGTEESLQKRRRIDYHHFSALFQTAALKKFEAAWALRNIVSPRDDIIQAATDDSCPQLLKLLGHRPTLLLIPNLPTVGKIFAGDDIQTQLVINADTIGSLLRRMKDNNLQLLVLPLIKEILISSTDEGVLRMACWALSYICEDRDDIQAILDADVGQHLVKLLRYPSNSVLYPALRTVSNIFAGFYHIQNVNKKIINADSVVSLARLIQNRQLLKEQVLPFLKKKLISSTDEDVLRVACWVLSCISDNEDYVKAILDAVGQQLVKLLKQLTSNSVFYPVIRTVANIFAGYDNQIQFMMIKTHWIAGKDY